VTSIDFHEPSIQWAREHNSLTNVQFIIGDVAKDLPLTRYYDVAIL
jgi:hypothetical protein